MALALLSLALAWEGPARAQAPAPAPEARPLLWSIGHGTPSYLFGTIHVPDARVLALPASVDRAIDGSAALFTEIPMDAATQMGVVGKVMLPEDRTLRDVIGAPLTDRLMKAVAQALPADTPAGTLDMLGKFLNRMKPWAAMTQLSLLEFLPDMMAGRQPLDKMLWDRAAQAGKEVGALETVDEQLGVFEQFSVAEQARMLELTLDALDEGRRKSRTMTQSLIDAYLGGDLDVLTRLVQDSLQGDRELMSRFAAVAIDERNRLMASRIRERIAQRPGKSCFFAVGAAHYAGERGIVSLLTQAGLEVTRVR